MNNRSFWILLLLALLSCTNADNASVLHGTVVDDAGNPLGGVSVTIANSAFSTTTDALGKYALDYAPGSLDLKFSKEGHDEASFKLDIATKVRYPVANATLSRLSDVEVYLKKAKSTLIAERTAGTAVESYQVDLGTPPPVFGNNRPLGDLAPFLVPTFIKELPTTDGWGNALRWTRNEGSVSYWITSAGGDGEFESAPQFLQPGTGNELDIIYSDGQFVQWPE